MLSARLAATSDLAVVEAITRAAYAPYVPLLGREPLPMTEPYAPRIAAGGVWIVVRGGADIGAIVLDHEPGHLLIFSLAVLPAAQGGGVGRWMLAFVEDRARQAGLAEVRLYTNPLMERNIRVYAEAGYAETGRRPNPYRPGWLMVDMAKRV